MIAPVLPDAPDWAGLRAAFGWDVPPDFSLARACVSDRAAAEPARVALIDVGADGTARRWSYGELDAASDRLAAAFARAGLARGDRVAVFLPQGVATILAHLAAWKIGAVSLPLFTLFGAEALLHRLGDSAARMVVTDAENLPKLAPLRDRLPALETVWTSAPAEGARDLWAAIAAQDPLPAHAPVGAEDPAVMIYTSGTTGAAKGVLHAHRFLIGHLPCLELAYDRFPQPGDVGWTPADWAWIGGLMDMAIPCLAYGVPLVAHRMRRFDPEAAFRLIAEQGISVMFLPPTALKLMRGAAVPPGLRIRAIASGGESLGAEMLDWGRRALGVTINEFYGQTECNLFVTSAATLDPPRPPAMGRAIPGAEVALFDAEGRAVPPGEVGEICVRRGLPTMMLGYWNRPEATAAKFRGDWLRTGDLGRMDAQGWITYIARDDDVITSSGYRIGPAEIEDCLAGDPDVVMAAAVGVPDPVRTEVVKVFVVLREGAAREGLAARLTARVRDRLGPHVAPREVVAVEALPMTATGKVMRRALRNGA